MIFVKADTGNCVPVFEVILWCYCWPFPSFFYTIVHFESCARQVRNIKAGGFEGCLKVIFSNTKELMSKLHEFNGLHTEVSSSFINFLTWTLCAMYVYNRSCNNFPCTALHFGNRIYEAFIYSLVFLFRARDVLNADCLLWNWFSVWFQWPFCITFPLKKKCQQSSQCFLALGIK